MDIKEMSDYDMGYADCKDGLSPILDFDSTNEADVEYMRGYNNAKLDAHYEDTSVLSKCSITFSPIAI